MGNHLAGRDRGKLEVMRKLTGGQVSDVESLPLRWLDTLGRCQQEPFQGPVLQT